MHQKVIRNDQEIVCFPSCGKTNKLKNRKLDFQSAIIFLKLREEGCKKKQAINFSKKDFCKIDTSKQKDGPSDCRILKTKNVKGLQINGWELSGQRDYNLGKRFKLLKQLEIHSDEEDQKITSIIEQKTYNNTHDYLYRIKVLENYQKDIEQKCHIPKYNKMLMQNKINEIQNEMIELQSNPIYHMKFKRVNLYEIFQDYPQTKELQDEYNSNYINLFDSFSHIYNKSEFQGKIQYSRLDEKQKTKNKPIVVMPELKQQGSFSSKNSIESQNNLILPIDEIEDKESNSQNQNQSQQSSPRSSKIPIKRASSLQNSFFKSKFSTILNKTIDSKDQQNSSSKSPKFKFVDISPKRSPYLNMEQETQMDSLFLSDSDQDQIQQDKFQTMVVPQLKQMEFSQKIDWLINSSIAKRTQQQHPINQNVNTSFLQTQIDKVKQVNDKIMKKSIQDFNELDTRSRFLTHQSFYRSFFQQTQKSFISNGQMSSKHRILSIHNSNS
ncbi:hypothetical protein ABPG74_009041 [Tetrahymena malaccensis]